MTRIVLAASMVAGLVLAPAAPLAAQTFARRDVPAGEVTGLEMSIEGSLRAVPGGRLAWLVTLYEVVQRRDLRPARDVALSVTSSFDPGRTLATARTDAEGRAELAIELPADLDQAPELMVEAISRRGIRRTFDASIELAPRHAIELIVDRDRAPPGGSVLALGRARDARDGSVLADVAVTLSARAGGAALRAPVTLRTDTRGVFSAVVALPDEPSEVALSAATEHASAHASVRVEPDRRSPIWVRATPARRLVAPGEIVDVEVEVRAADGAPIEGARVDFADQPQPDDRLVRTDARGRATLRWDIERRSVTADVADRSREIRVVHPGHGTATGAASVRVARRTVFVTWAVEGGALAHGLPSRLLVRVTAADGTVRPGREIALEAARLGGGARTATTDRDGVAAFDVTLAPGEAIDGCGGPAATEATVTVDGAREALCLPIDPDATLAVRARDTGDSIALEVHRRADVARSAVVATALARGESGWTPVARTVLAAGESRGAIALGPRAPGEIWIRARAVVGAGQEVLGGSTLLWRGGAAPAITWTAGEQGASVAALDTRSTQAMLVLDPARALALRASLEESLGPIGTAIAEGRGELFVAALAGSQVPVDAAASAVLRAGVVEPLPLPDDAVSLGLLRDPWRTRARFVRGRLGSLMRAVEEYVDANVPDGIEEVAIREGSRWRFDREVLEAALAASGLGDERAAALDGEPLDIDALTALDPAFTFDHVAERITRERLFRVLGLLRDLVRDRELDLPWARRGDPRQYPLSLLEAEVAWRDVVPERQHLFDAWGQPFALVPVRGRPRFDFLQPVSGYELVSAGPDGRIGTRDDVVDPFSRVLQSGGVYAEAVGEDVLIARLRSVALGRATVEALAAMFELETASWEAEAGVAPSASWDAAPEPIDALPLPPAPVPALASFLGEVRPGEPGAPTSITWSLPRERRPYVALALVLAEDGGAALANQAFEAGAPVAARVDLPAVMRPGETLRIPLTVVRLIEAPEPTVSVRASSDAIAVRVEDGAVVIEARRIGAATIAIALETAGAAPWTAEHRVRVLPAGTLRATHTGAIAAPEARFDLALAADARAWRAQLVVGAPQALRRDPLWEGPRFAAIAAWADVVGGGEPDPEQVAAMERSSADLAALHTACALVVWAAREQPPSLAITAAQRLQSELPTDLGARAAVLAALAPAAPRIIDASRSGDPVTGAIARLRQDAWRALATERDRPSVMARMAAALLLADREDTIGRALFEQARAAAGPEGLDPATPDAYVGTLALVIAARQLGEDALADALAPAILRRLYLAPRLGAEAVFWALAASTYGALGAGAPGSVDVEIDGRVERVSLEDGARAIEVRPGAAIRIRAPSPVWARLESRSLRALEARQDAPVALRVEGELGRAGERASLEIVIESTSDTELGELVLEIGLPSAGALDEHARAALLSSSAVARIEESDGAGIVRVHLAPLRARASHRLPLAITWRGSGETSGLALVAYERPRPWVQSILPARPITLEVP